jgi:hypothetical protein
MKLTTSIICFFSFCLVTLVVQKQVQGAEAQLPEETLQRLGLSLIRLIKNGAPRTDPWFGISKKIGSVDAEGKDTFDEFTECMKEFCEELPKPKTGLFAITDDNIKKWTRDYHEACFDARPIE